MEINNRNELIHNLADLIKETEKQLLPYQMDIYAYIDEETGNVTLDTFTNVGGNSWINDDHYTIYRVKQSCNRPIDYYETAADVAEAIGIDLDELRRQTAADCDCELDEIDDVDIKHFASSKYENEIEADFLSWYGDDCDYYAVAEEAVNEFEDHLDDED